jgi:endonuclease/exonuclease/phosphatase family metal-dependent hydrolase
MSEISKAEESMEVGWQQRARHTVFRLAVAVGALGIFTAPSVPNDEVFHNSTQEIQDGEPIRTATTNTHSWLTPDGSESNKDDFEQFIVEEEPDVVCGQEAILSGSFLKSIALENGYSLVEAPTRLVPFVDSGAYGNFLMSKYEIKKYEVHDLPMDVSLTDPQKILRPRKFIHAQLAREGGEPLDVIVFHLEGKGDDDVEQLQHILGYVALHLADKPVVLCGDANNAAVYRDIAGANQVPEDTPFLATFPMPAPTLALDVIRVLNTESGSVDEYTLYDGRSDHLYLLATVQLSPSAE